MQEREHLSDEDLAVYASALIAGTTGQLEEAMRDHVAGCDYCSKNVFQLVDILEEQRGAPPGKHSKVISESHTKWYKTVRPVAAAALVAGVTGIYFLWGYHQNAGQEMAFVPAKQPVMAVQSDANRQGEPVRQKVGATAQQVEKRSAELELLVSSSVNATDCGITGYPEIVIEADDVCEITWKNGSERVAGMELYNSKGDLYWSCGTRAQVIRLLERPAKGLYYYKLFNDKRTMVWCGRLLIK